MSKYKICFVLVKNLPDSSGIARSAMRLIQFLTEAGMEVHIVIPIDSKEPVEGAYYQRLVECAESPQPMNNGAFIYRVSIHNSATKMSTIMETIRILDYKHKFDLFHAYWLPLAFPCLMIAALGNRPVIGSIRGNDAATEAVLPENLPYIQAVLNSATWITAVCSDLIEGISGIVDISHKSSVVLNGINSSNFPVWKGFEATRGVVGTIGELRYKKAIPMLAQAYGGVPQTLRKNLLLGGFYSDPNEEKAVEAVIQKLGLEKERIHTGYLDRHALLEKMTELNVFVVNSYHDGLPNTLLEASACGVPIVAARVAGMRDVLVDGKNALLFEPGNTEQLANAITRLLNDRELCEKISEGALALAKKLDCEREKNCWLGLYENLLKEDSKVRYIA